MLREHILAHRGTWKIPSEKNSDEAISKALLAGYGLETDIRDLDGKLVVSHDMPRSGEVRDIDWLLDIYASNGCRGVLALNIKADGLAALLKSKLDEYGVDRSRYFVFDMSIPDTLAYFNHDIPVYSRLSEYESELAFADKCEGVWLDNFTGDYPQIKRMKELVAAGRKVALVSPELHRRPHQAVWDAFGEAGLIENELSLICSDFPDEAAAFMDAK